eukprot:3377100-Amphidinium_carterae.1
MRVAQAEYDDGQSDEAIKTMRDALEKLQGAQRRHIILLVEASAQLARWLEAAGNDDEALSFLEIADKAAKESFEEEDVKTLEIR